MSFAALQPLHEAWQRYVFGLLTAPPPPQGAAGAGTSGADSPEARLARADLHGALLTVASSKARAYAGAAGIVAADTARTFQIVGADDRVRVVPKGGCVFEFGLPAGPAGGRTVTLQGDVLLAAGAAAAAEAARRAGGAKGRAATAAAARQQRQLQQRQKQLQQREKDRAKRQQQQQQQGQKHQGRRGQPSQSQRKQARPASSQAPEPLNRLPLLSIH
jgi:RNase P/RNase MRP subunit p29